MNATHPLTKLLTVLAVTGLTHFLGGYLSALDSSLVELPASSEQPVDARLVEIVSLGHLPSWVDGLVIRSYRDPAYDPVTIGQHPPLFFDLMLATELDPGFEELYSYGGTLLSVIRRDGPGTALLLDRAHQQILRGRFARSANYLEILRGYNALIETQDYEVAEDAFSTVAKTPGAPPYLQTMISKLGTTEGRFALAKNAYSHLLSRKNDEQVQRQIEDRWQALQLAERLYRINREFSLWRGPRMGSQELFDRFRKGGYAELRWDSTRQKVETREPRDALKGFY